MLWIKLRKATFVSITVANSGLKCSCMVVFRNPRRRVAMLLILLRAIRYFMGLLQKNPKPLS
jgi:hypothetical protein